VIIFAGCERGTKHVPQERTNHDHDDHA
jgi:hypothetical protein